MASGGVESYSFRHLPVLGRTRGSNEPASWDAGLAAGIAYRLQGKLQLSRSIDTTRQAASTAKNRILAVRIGRFPASGSTTRSGGGFAAGSLCAFSGTERARYALDLGNLEVMRRRPKDAQDYYEKSLTLADGNPAIHAIAGLNLARLAAEPDKLAKLTAPAQESARIDDPSVRARLYLNLGEQARRLDKPAIQLAYRSVEQARQVLTKQEIDYGQLQTETLDELAQLKIRATGDAYTASHRLCTCPRPGTTGDLLIKLERRQGRLQQALGQLESGAGLPINAP